MSFWTELLWAAAGQPEPMLHAAAAHVLDELPDEVLLQVFAHFRRAALWAPPPFGRVVYCVTPRAWHAIFKRQVTPDHVIGS